MKHPKRLLYLLAPLLMIGLQKSPVQAQELSSVSYESYTDSTDSICHTIREAMKNRDSDINIKFSSSQPEAYYSTNYSGGVESYLFSDQIFQHTGIPTEGDYLKWQYADWTAESSCELDESTGMYLYDITYNITYYTDNQQEAAVTGLIDEFKSQYMTDSSISDYEKISIIYDYICSNVTYDDSGADMQQYTCYGALVNHSAVCQGYSLLLYRLALECGLDARIIASQNHGWNIVKVDGEYYNADASADAGSDDYKCFLVSNGSLSRMIAPGHADYNRLTQYNSSDFNSRYNMCSADYGTVLTSGITGVRPATPHSDAKIVRMDMAQILRRSYNTRPDYSTVIADLPDSADVVLSDGSQITIPLEWECLGEYDSLPQYFYYEFDIVSDTLPYEIDEAAIIPYAGIFIGSGNVTVDSVTGRYNESIIANYLFTEMDCNNATVAGILANIYSESGFNPTASVMDTNNKISYGICQWNGGRFDSLRNFCESRGYDYSSLHGQLNYLKHELFNVSPYNTRWYNEIKQSDNDADAAYRAGLQWAARFEVCATRYREGRARLARDTYWPEYASYRLNGLIKLSDGTIALFQDGVRNRSYTGIYNDNSMGWMFLQNGCVDMNYDGLFCDVNLGWRKIANGTIDKNYNDMFYSPSIGCWKIKNGCIDFDYTDLYFSPSRGWVKVAFGALDTGYNDLYCSPTLGWWKITNGCIDLEYNDLYCSPTYGWWKIYGGTIDFTYSDLYCSPTLGWWKVTGGVPDFTYNDLYCSPTLGWWKVSFGTIDFGYTDLYCSPTLGWWKVVGGTLDLTYNDLYCSPTLGWWKINYGTIDFGYNDLYCSLLYGWWKVVGGTLDLGYTDLYCSPTLGWWKIHGGAIEFTYNGLYNSPQYGWWKIVDGTIDFTYTGPYTSRPYGTYDIRNGQVMFR